MYVVTSPHLSPLTTYRDSDGDGFSDANDAAPHDRMKWASGIATVAITVKNNNSSSIQYEVLVDGKKQLSGSLDPRQFRVDTIEVSFIYGIVETKQMIFTATCVSNGSVLWSDEQAMNLTDGGHYAVSLKL